MGIRESVLDEVARNLKAGNRVPKPLIEKLVKSLEQGPVTKESLGTLIKDNLTDGNKDQEANN